MITRDRMGYRDERGMWVGWKEGGEWQKGENGIEEQIRLSLRSLPNFSTLLSITTFSLLHSSKSSFPLSLPFITFHSPQTYAPFVFVTFAFICPPQIHHSLISLLRTCYLYLDSLLFYLSLSPCLLPISLHSSTYVSPFHHPIPL